MCARYTLTLEQARLVIAGLVHIFAFAPRYNIGPAQRVPVILDTAEGVKAVEMRWGIPLLTCAARPPDCPNQRVIL